LLPLEPPAYDQDEATLAAWFVENGTWFRFGITVLPALVRGDRFGHFWLDNYKWATGTIIRFDVNNDDPANVHIDFGISK